jgi:hypothetical protein
MLDLYAIVAQEKIISLDGNSIVEIGIIMLIEEDLNMDVFKDFLLVFLIWENYKILLPISF